MTRLRAVVRGCGSVFSGSWITVDGTPMGSVYR
jgi:hypothetical protein